MKDFIVIFASILVALVAYFGLSRTKLGKCSP